MTTRQSSSGTRRIVALPGSRIERLCACRYDVGLSYARQRFHSAARVVPCWLLASDAVRVAALRVTVTNMPAVILDAERLERHRKGLWLRRAGRSRVATANQYARPSIGSLRGTAVLCLAEASRAAWRLLA